MRNQIEHFLATTIRKTKYDAKMNRNLEFSIDLDYLLELLTNQNNKCALTGWDLEFIRGGDWYCGKNPKGCTMDRIDNNLGYIKGNIQLVCGRVNVMRGAMPLDEFRAMCKSIGERG